MGQYGRADVIPSAETDNYNKLATKHPQYLQLVAGPRLGTTPSLSPFGSQLVLVYISSRPAYFSGH